MLRTLKETDESQDTKYVQSSDGWRTKADVSLAPSIQEDSRPASIQFVINDQTKDLLNLETSRSIMKSLSPVKKYAKVKRKPATRIKLPPILSPAKQAELVDSQREMSLGRSESIDRI